jgi:amidophosphoribosyltransferase
MLPDILKTKREEVVKDHCGVFGIYGKGADVAKITYFAQFSLQHRGQEGAGIVVSNGKRLKAVRKLGLVNTIFNEKNLSRLTGHIAIGHNRYSTTGGNTKQNVQPVIVTHGKEVLSVGHNGNLVNAAALAQKLPHIPRASTSDTEILALSILHNPGKTLTEKITNATMDFAGAYSCVAMNKNTLFAFRDPWGIRPLSLGKLNGGFVVASETCAFDMIGATYIRDIAPGEIIAIDAKGYQTAGMIQPQGRKFCLFEYVYIARPDSIMNEQLVHQVRRKSGEILAEEAPVNADLVVAIPDSGTSAALGFSHATGIQFGEILIKNRYIGRTFISPEQHLREQGVKMKFNPMMRNVDGKRIVIVDDSIVRGTTMRQIVEVLRACNAKEIHLRICSPPVTHPCYFGVDTAHRKQLIAAEKTIPEIEEYIGADSLHYLSLDGLIKATRQGKSTFCTACFSGKYPMNVDYNFEKSVFEKVC